SPESNLAQNSTVSGKLALDVNVEDPQLKLRRTPATPDREHDNVQHAAASAADPPGFSPESNLINNGTGTDEPVIGMNESDFLRALYQSNRHAGDDLAMLPNDQVIGVDQCLDGRHALLKECGPAAFGRKAM